MWSAERRARQVLVGGTEWADSQERQGDKKKSRGWGQGTVQDKESFLCIYMEIKPERRLLLPY